MKCYSGGADGSDLCFEHECEQKGIQVLSMSFEGHKCFSNLKNRVILSQEDLAKANLYLVKANLKLKRNLKLNAWYLPLLQRNYYQVKDVDYVIAVGKILPDNNVDGGTGWAIQMAKDLEVPTICIFDQEVEKIWKFWNYGTLNWENIDYIPPIQKDFAGIGTRKLNLDGQDAIKQVIQNIGL